MLLRWTEDLLKRCSLQLHAKWGFITDALFLLLSGCRTFLPEGQFYRRIWLSGWCLLKKMFPDVKEKWEQFEIRQMIHRRSNKLIPWFKSYLWACKTHLFVFFFFFFLRGRLIAEPTRDKYITALTPSQTLMQRIHGPDIPKKPGDATSGRLS